MTNLLSKLKGLARDDSGAVTVDWVVLTAAIVVVGVAVVTTISPGLTNASDNIRNTIVSADPL